MAIRAALVNIGLSLAAFAAATVLAELAGAADLGTSMTFGQLGFALAATYALARR